MNDRPTVFERIATPLAMLAALAYNLTNFIFPFFEDSGRFAAFGRLMLDGLLPFRDMWDQKPPGIFVITYLTAATVGTSSIASRCIELLFILAMAIACGRIARLVSGAGGLPVGIVVCGALSSTLLWGLPERGQVEFYQGAVMAWGAYCIAAFLCGGRHRSILWAGMLIGVACWLKPQAVLFGAALCAVLIAWHWQRRRRRDALRSLALFALGIGLVSLFALAWMWWTGMLKPFLFVMFSTNAYYLAKSAAPDFGEAILAAVPFHVTLRALICFWLMVAVGCGKVFFRASVNDSKLWIGLLLSVWLGCAFLQFYSGHYLFNYHKIVMIPVVSTLVAIGLVTAYGVVLSALQGKVSSAISHTLAFGLALLLFVQIGWNGRVSEAGGVLVAWVSGRIQTDDVYGRYGREMHYYDYRTEVLAAEYVRGSTAAANTMQVIGRAGTFDLYVDRKPASPYLGTFQPYDEQNPDREKEHASFMNDLQRNAPAVILLRLNDSFPWFNLPASVDMVSRDPLMQQFLADNYAQETEIGNYFRLYRRRHR